MGYILLRGNLDHSCTVIFSLENMAFFFQSAVLLLHARLCFCLPQINIVLAGVRLLRLNVNPKGYGQDSNKIPIHEPNLANITIEDTGKTGWLSD